MTLQTHQELKLLERVERIEELIDVLLLLCLEIRAEQVKERPKFHPTRHIKVTP